MSARMGNPKTTFVKTIKASRADGTPVEICEYRVTGTDPTLNGTIWATPMSFPVYKLRSGEDVDFYGDSAMVTHTGEMLTVR
jgi:hypothetical protein